MHKLLKILSRNEFLIFFTYFCICFAYVQPLFRDPDVAWHAASGHLIWQLKSVPTYDIWSFASDQKWYNISWLWDLLTSFLYDFLPLSYIETLDVFLHSLLAVYIYVVLIKRSSVREDAKNVVITLVSLVIWQFSSFRPNIASLFFAVFIYSHLRDFGRVKILIYFPLLCLVWANMHGGFLVGFVILGAFFLEAIAEKDYKSAFIYFESGLFGALACLINPYGFELIIAVLRTLDSQITGYIQEWQPFTFGKEYTETLMFVFVILFTQMEIKGGKLHEKVLYYAWLFMGLFSIRNFVYFAVLGLPHILRCFDQNLPIAKYTKPISIKLRILIIGFLIVFAIIARPYYKENNQYMFDKIPVEEINFVKLHHGGKNIYNEYDIGGYIAYYADGKIKHFIDGRAGTAFSEARLGEAIDSFFYTERWKKIFAMYDIDVALIGRVKMQNKVVADFFKDWKVQMVGIDYIVLAH